MPRGPRRRLVSFVVDDPEPMLWGGELVLRDGVPGRPGHQRRVGADRRRLRRAGYVADPAGVTSREWAGSGGFAVNVGGSVHPVTVSLRAPYDPDNERVRSDAPRASSG